jgi:hypothetical protein
MESLKRPVQLGDCFENTVSFMRNDRMKTKRQREMTAKFWLHYIALSFILIVLIVALPAASIAHLNYGLVSYYPFNNGSSIDESGNGNNATRQGPLAIQDRFGDAERAYGFDGLNDYLKVTSSQLSIRNSLSISLWVRNSDTSFSDNYVNYILSKGDTPSTPWNDFSLVITKERNIAFRLTNVSDQLFIISTKPIADNAYHHIVAIYDYENSVAKIYLVSYQ